MLKKASIILSLFLLSALFHAQGKRQPWSLLHEEEILNSKPLPPRLAQAFLAQFADLNQACGKLDVQEIIRKARFKWIRLDSKKTLAAIVQPADMCSCSPTGNCLFWVFEQTSSGYKPLLSAKRVQGFSIEAASSHGFHDIATFAHDSAFEQTLHVYKFDGSKYQLNQCWSRTFQDNVRKPKYERADCS